MGTDKARLVREGGMIQAEWLRVVLERASYRVVEVGPGVSGAEVIADDGQGPHRAIVGAVRELDLRPQDLVVVVPVDLYRVSVQALSWLWRMGLDGPFAVRRANGPAWDLAGGWVAGIDGSAARLSALWPGARLVALPPLLEAQLQDADDPRTLAEQLMIEGRSGIGSS